MQPSAQPDTPYRRNPAMSSAQKDGGPAFPVIQEDMAGVDGGPGMSLRLWFAGQALASGMAPCNHNEHKEIAKWCDRQADAMLAQREKPND